MSPRFGLYCFHRTHCFHCLHCFNSFGAKKLACLCCGYIALWTFAQKVEWSGLVFLADWGLPPSPFCKNILADSGKNRQEVFDLLPGASAMLPSALTFLKCIMWWCCLNARWYFGICNCAHWENEKRKRHQSKKEDL